MVGQQQQIDISFQAHGLKCCMAPFPGPGFDALARCRLATQTAEQKAHAQRSGEALAMRQPGIGLPGKSMMNMQRKHTDAIGGTCRGVKKRSGVPAAAERDG